MGRLKVCEVQRNGVWSWSNVLGATCEEDAIFLDTDVTPQLARQIARDSDVKFDAVRFLDARPQYLTGQHSAPKAPSAGPSATRQFVEATLSIEAALRSLQNGQVLDAVKHLSEAIRALLPHLR